MHIGILSDIHFHNWAYGAKILENGFNSRLIDLYESLCYAIKEMSARRVDTVLITGDLYHTHDKLNVQVVCKAVEFMYELSQHFEVFIIPGNHDMASADGKVHSLEMFKPLQRVHVLDEEAHFTYQGKQFHALPYTTDRDKLLTFLDKTQPNSITMIHQGVKGTHSASAMIQNELLGPSDLETKNGRLIIAGHYHQVYYNSDIGLLVPGSFTQQTWADAKQWRGWWTLQGQSAPVPVVSSGALFCIYNGEQTQDLQLIDGGTGGIEARKNRLNVVASSQAYQGCFLRIHPTPNDITTEELLGAINGTPFSIVEFIKDTSDSMLVDTASDLAVGDFDIDAMVAAYKETYENERRREVGEMLRMQNYGLAG